MKPKVDIAKKVEDEKKEKIITTISDLDFVKRLNSNERNELVILLKEQYKQGFLNGSKLENNK